MDDLTDVVFDLIRIRVIERHPIKVFSRDEQYVFRSSLKDKVFRLNTESNLKDVTFAVAAMFLTLEGLLVIIWMQELVGSVATALGNRIEAEGNTI